MSRVSELYRGCACHRRWLRVTLLPVLVSAFALGTACRGNTNSEDVPEPVPVTTLSVKNQAFLDMNIFVYRSSLRTRLGTASGSNTTRFTLPSSMLFGTTPLRFQAVPIGGNRASITQEIAVTPGDAVELVIPPN